MDAIADERRISEPRLPRLTAEVYVLSLEGPQYLLYAPLLSTAFIVNSQVVRVLAALESGAHDGELDPDGSVVEGLRRLGIIDGPRATPPASRLDELLNPTSVTLLLTSSCNLRCRYCYAAAGERPAKSMSLETAKRAIEFVVANALACGAPHFEVAYHGGGEPTTHWSVLTASLLHARQRAAAAGLAFSSSLTSNGVLQDHHIDWIVSHLQSADISFDGLPEVQDRNRPFPGGGRSSPLVEKTLHRFDAAGFRYAVRVTVTPQDIDRLPDSVEYICREFHPAGTQVEPAYAMGRWADAPALDADRFVEAFREARRRAARLGHTITFSGARLGTLTNHFCGASRDSFCISPSGNVTACYEACSEDNPWADVFFYGWPDANGGYRFDFDRLRNLRSQTVDRRDHCAACFAKWSCAGDCFYKALVRNGRGAFRGAGRCHIIRELTKDQILEKICAAGGLVWRQTQDAAPLCGSQTKGRKE